MTLLFAVLEPAAFVVLQHSMFPAIMAITETAVADDPLRRFFAVLVGATHFSRRHAAPQRKCDVDGGGWRDIER